jgi:4-hydroxy-2-oxoheptanedioate aldolase
MVTMLQAISTTPTVPLVRVPWLEPGIVMKALDAGAYGVIAPMVNTREDAQQLVACTHYAPAGSRSFGPVRALLCGGADYPSEGNRSSVAFAMKEAALALDKPDDILSVEGLDASIEHIIECTKAHGVAACIHNGRPDVALARIGKAFRFVTVSSDARLLASGSQKLLGAMRRGS